MVKKNTIVSGNDTNISNQKALLDDDKTKTDLSGSEKMTKSA